MKKLIIIFLFFISLSAFHTSLCQTTVREDFLDAEFFLSLEEYKDALYAYNEVYKAGYENNANINYRIGVCYLNIPGEKVKSIPYLEKAVNNISRKWVEGSFKEDAAPYDALLYLGNAYRINYQLDKAINIYKKYKATLNESKADDIKFTDQQISSCERAKKAVQNPASIYKENLGNQFNSASRNYNALISGDRNTMLYMNELRFYDGVFVVENMGESWSNSMNITPQIESDGDQFISSISFNGKKLYLVKIDNFDGEIYESESDSDRWMPAKPIGRPVNSKYFESHCTISPNGKTLYFTSNRPESIGEMDIFVSTRNASGVWSEPKNLGGVINTPLNEETPYIDIDGKTLYFSSQGHETIGGYDYFKTVKQSDGKWTTPEPLPYPVNTTDDDLFFVPADRTNSGFITLYDSTGYGSGDLYYVEFGTELSEDGKPGNPFPWLSAAREKRIKELSLNQQNSDTTGTISEQQTDQTTQTKDQTATSQEKADETGITIGTSVSSKIEAPPVKVVFKPVFFEFDSYALSDISKEKLNEIADACSTFPQMTLELRGHTDAMGADAYNKVLSEKRSKAVADYLSTKNIDRARMTTIGLSESEHVALNRYPDGRDSKKGRSLNRRVEIRVNNAAGALIIIEPIEVPEDLKAR